MQDFSLYFELGWEHILDWLGYDHILFVTVLCGIYLLRDWRQVLILVTAFTVGHSVTLALSLFDKIKVSAPVVEFLIPVTIMITALSNIFSKNRNPQAFKFSYFLAFAFGLIHGLGFSNYLKSLLGKSSNIVIPLFAFNVGLEFGQIIIVLTVLILSFLIVQVLKASRREWNLFLSSAIFGVAFMMALERLGELIK